MWRVALLCLIACGGATPTPVANITPPAGDMPEFQVTEWINSEPLSPAKLRGKVVLVDFWEYTCVNCVRTLPFVKAWHARYADVGLVVIGIHAPEFDFGKDAANVHRGVREYGLTYPIALDNDFETWRAYENRAWPAKYLFDAAGKLRGTWIGEGDYPEIEASIRALLVDAGGGAGALLPAVTEETVRWDADWAARKNITAETYLGTARRVDKSFRLEGEWTHHREYVEHVGKDPGRIVLEFVAGEVNLVMTPGPSGMAAVKVKLDGHVIEEGARGADVGNDAYARFDRSGMIRLVAGARKETHELVLETRDPGLRAFAFTFGP